MRARLTYRLLSPATPALVAHGITRLLVLAAATAGLLAVVSGAASHVIFSGVLELAGVFQAVAA